MGLSGVMSDLLQSIFGNVYSWIIKPFSELRSFKGLIYGKDGDTDLAYGIFSNKEITDIYTPGMNVFVAIAVTALLVGIVLAGMKIASSGINPSNRTYVIEFFKDLMIVGLLLFNLSTLYQVIFGLNYTIVNVFSDVQKELIEIPPELDISKGALGMLIINLVLLGLSIWANFYYMMRRLTLLLLMIMGPLMVVLYLIPQTKAMTMGWLKELFGTVMVQSVHAALYWMVALMSLNTSNGIEGVILYVIFIPVSESLRSLLGLGGQMNDRLSKSAAMFGGAALAGVYGSIRGAMKGKSVAEALRNATGQMSKAVGGGDGKDDKEGSKQLLNNAGTDTGSTTRAERMLKAGEIFSKGGKAVFGAAGAIMGSPMGPMGSIVSSTAGFNSGGVVGGLAGRTGQALAEGGVRRLGAGIKAGVGKYKGVKNGESLADEKLAQSIADDETTKWASENKDVLSDIKQRFPDSWEQPWKNQLDTKRGEFLQQARGKIGELKKSSNLPLYSGKSVNREAIASKLAGAETGLGKQEFIDNAVSSGSTPQEALHKWKQEESPRRFKENFNRIRNSLPVNVDHPVIGNKAERMGKALVHGAKSFAGSASGMTELGKFVSDTKLGQGFTGLALGAKESISNFDTSQGVVTGLNKAIATPISAAVSHFKNHTPSNVIGKQAAFKNGVAYTAGIVGGVRGYKAGASFASGGTSNITRIPGSLSFGLNPYNNAVNQQIAEVSDIAHMVQTVKGPNGESTIANGAIRMVTTAKQTVIQVKDKSGHTHTVSRMGSGDSSLQKGQTIYQDLALQQGQLAPSSNVYQEDSGGGRITLNRSINVNPNRIVGNRNTPRNPRVVQEVQSYNQKVDSGQYHVREAISEMSNIQMVVDRNRSYMVGTKGGQQYRISQYGPGDARLTTEGVVYRTYEVRNNKLIHSADLNSEQNTIEYSNSMEPSKLMNPPNKRNANRQQLEKFRHKSFTESLR